MRVIVKPAKLEFFKNISCLKSGVFIIFVVIYAFVGYRKKIGEKV